MEKAKTKDKKRMRPQKFLAVFASVTAALLIVAIVATVVMNYWYVVMNEVFGKGTLIVTSPEGTEDFDTDYYDSASETADEVEEEARAISEETEEEGAVLLKNNGVLPVSTSASQQTELAVFGWGFEYPVYGGTGSGSMSPDMEITPEEGLENANFSVNETLRTVYSEWATANDFDSRPTAGLGYTHDWQLPEMPLTTEAATAKGEGADIAVFWITRQGGEGVDLPMTMGESGSHLESGDYGYNPEKSYLELSDEEEAVLDVIESEYSDVIVIINSSNAMELGELEDDENVGAILWIGGPGQCGFNAVGSILSGAVNPSGRLVDTYYADFMADPTYTNFSDPDIYSGNPGSQNIYSNVNPDTSNTNAYFVDYEEGIYVGYRYYETRYGDDEEEYAAQVVYPFGYGLSYTEFEQTLSDVVYDGEAGTVTVSGTVTNTGDMDGKEVVQVYYEPPYDEDGSHIQKASKNLVGFDKVEVAAGGTEEFEIVFREEDMVSYDQDGYYAENGAYVLEEGDYVIHLGKNAHEDWDSGTIAVSSTKVYADEALRGTAVGKREGTEKVEENAFTDSLVGSNITDIMDRSDWEGTYPTAATDSDRTASDELLTYLQDYVTGTSSVSMPETGADNGVTLTALRGLSYDDELWDDFLDQFTVAQMRSMIYEGGFQITSVESLGVPLSSLQDGPSALKTSGLGTEATSTTLTGMPSEVVIASTWNVDIAGKIGDIVGREGVQYEMSGWYAPGLNTHRSPFAGRNFEYFSEDGYLAGTMCTAEVAAAADHGLVAYLKHFAMNDQESYRNQQSTGDYKYSKQDVTLCTWADEQTIREIYLKPFEMVVKNARMTVKYISDENGTVSTVEMQACTGIMSSFNYVGNTWAGGNSELLTDVLRGEWGFVGTVTTDAAFFDFMNPNQMIRAGGDLYLYTGSASAFDNESDAGTVTAMRNAVHNICYTVAYSNAVNGLSPYDTISYSLAVWQICCIIAIVVTGVAFVAVAVLGVLGLMDQKKHPEKYREKKAKS